jgi:hypothetical protein
MTETEGMHVKVTINDLYREQQETNKLLIQLVAKVENLSDLPERVRALEKSRDETSWIPKLLWTALVAGVGGFITALYQLIIGK